jgi:hypothetical protein
MSRKCLWCGNYIHNDDYYCSRKCSAERDAHKMQDPAFLVRALEEIRVEKIMEEYQLQNKIQKRRERNEEISRQVLKSYELEYKEKNKWNLSDNQNNQKVHIDEAEFNRRLNEEIKKYDELEREEELRKEKKRLKTQQRKDKEKEKEKLRKEEEKKREEEKTKKEIFRNTVIRRIFKLAYLILYVYGVLVLGGGMFGNSDIEFLGYIIQNEETLKFASIWTIVGGIILTFIF